LEAPAPRPRLRVAAILQLEGGIVLVRHVKGDTAYHLLPGGGVEAGESIDLALRREVLEETGLLCELVAPLFISDSIDPDGGRHMVQLTFLARIVGGDLTTRPDDPAVISVEVVDPRSLEPLDVDTILASVRKTGRMLVVHEAPERGGVGAEIVRRAMQHIDKKRAALNLPKYDASKWGKSGDARMPELIALPLEERIEAVYGAPAR